MNDPWRPCDVCGRKVSKRTFHRMQTHLYDDEVRPWDCECLDDLDFNARLEKTTKTLEWELELGHFSDIELEDFVKHCSPYIDTRRILESIQLQKVTLQKEAKEDMFKDPKFQAKWNKRKSKQLLKTENVIRKIHVPKMTKKAMA